MSRVGFSVGLAGQEAKPTAILGLFTHGVSMGLAIWAIWVARGHLRKVFRQVVRPPVSGGIGNRDFISSIGRVWDFGRRYLYGFLAVQRGL